MFVAMDIYTPFPVGSLIKMKAGFGGENWGTGLIVQYMSPHAKAYEPAGMYQVTWSSGPEAAADIEDCWYDARHIELIAQPAHDV